MTEKDPHLLFYQSLGKQIKDERLLRKISQDDLAKSIKLSRVSVVNIEKGIQKIQVHTLILLASILDLDLNHLKALISTETNKNSLNKNYLNRMEKSEVGDLKNLKKSLENLKKHL